MSMKRQRSHGQLETTYITQWFPPEPAQISDGIARALQEHGHKVTVLTGIPNYPTGVVNDGYSAWRPLTQVVNGITIRRAPLYPSHDSSAVRRILNYASWAISATVFGFGILKKSDVAVVYSGPATAALPAMIWRRLTRTPFVLMIQDLWPDSVLATGFLSRGAVRRLASTIISWFCTWAYGSAAHIIVISPGAIVTLESRGVPRDKISLIYNWAEETIAEKVIKPSDARAEFGLPTDAFVISYAGNHGLAQGLDVIVRAASRLRDLTDVWFLFVGDGLEAQTLRNLAEALGCTHVVFAGQVPHTSMSTVQAASNIQLVSLTNDPVFRVTMPSKVQSILASGTAVIALAEGDAATVIDLSGAGWSVTPGDSDGLVKVVRQAYADGRDSLNNRGDAGREYYRVNMSEAVSSARLDTILREVALKNMSRKMMKGHKP